MIDQIRKGMISFILPIVYIIIICPISLLLRLINKKIIPTKFDENKNSYWHKKSEEAEGFYKQF